jgi:hypothetical protein
MPETEVPHNQSSTPEERITAEPVSGRKSRKISVKSRELMPHELGYEDKYVLEGVMQRNAKTKRVSLIERPYNDPERIIKIWRCFKEAGLPVVPTMRRTEDKTLLVTNLKVNGSEFFGKGYWYHRTHNPDIKDLPLTDIERQFLRATEPESMDQIKKLALYYADSATSNQIELPIDDTFELQIHPDGRWELRILDLRRGLVGKEAAVIARDTLESTNRRNADYFMLLLEKIRNHLLEKQILAEHNSQL